VLQGRLQDLVGGRRRQRRVAVQAGLGAAMQEYITALLIDVGQAPGGQQLYDFDSAILFWIGSSAISMLLAASLWNTKVRD